MFLILHHQKLEVYSYSRKFVQECYKVTKIFPPEEKFGLTSQIRRAAISVHLNISEGFSRKSTAERKRYFEIARGSIIEIDAAMDVANDLEYLSNYELLTIGETTISCFKLLSKLIQSNISN